MVDPQVTDRASAACVACGSEFSTGKDAASRRISSV